MKNQFEETMSKKSSIQLEKIINSEPGDYKAEAIEAAKKEIQKRSLFKQKISTYTDEKILEIINSQTDYYLYEVDIANDEAEKRGLLELEETKKTQTRINKKVKKLKINPIIVIGILIAIFFVIDKIEGDGDATPKTKEEIRRERVERHFSSWDGSHRELTKVIKNSMNDPNSYEHVETTYLDRGDHLVVKTTFRGKNAFGGMVLNWVKAKVDLNGNVVEIQEQGP